MTTTKRTLHITRVVNACGGPIQGSKVVKCQMCGEDCFACGPALALSLDEYRLLCEYCAPANPVKQIGFG